MRYLFAFALLACDTSPPPEVDPSTLAETPASVSVSPTTIRVSPGGTHTFTAKVKGSSNSVSWAAQQFGKPLDASIGVIDSSTGVFTAASAQTNSFLFATDVDIIATLAGTNATNQAELTIDYPCKFTSTGEAAKNNTESIKGFDLVGTQAYVLLDSQLVVYDVTTPAYPQIIGGTGAGLTVQAFSVDASNNAAVIATLSDIWSVTPVNYSDAKTPVVGVPQLLFGGQRDYGVSALTAHSPNKLLVASGGAGQVVDLTTPATPALLPSASPPASAAAFAMDDTYIYEINTGAAGGLWIYSTADFSEVGNFQVPDTLTFAALSGDRVYAAGAGAFYIFDVSDRTHPKVAETPALKATEGLEISGNTLFTINTTYTIVYSLEKPDAPEAIAWIEAAGKDYRLGKTTLAYSTTSSIFTLGNWVCEQ